MKFTEHLKHLGAHITQEWQSQYLNYEDMKIMIYDAVDAAELAQKMGPDALSKHLDEFDETFFNLCNKELNKVNTFYSEKLSEATRKFSMLQSQVVKARTATVSPRIGFKTMATISRKKLEELKLTFSEFYLSLILLQTYQILNYMGFRKIVKKHDRLLNLNSGAKWRSTNLESAYFHTNRDINWLITETESSFANVLEGGDKQKAMKRLRVPPLGERHAPWTTFRVGLFSGSFIVLFLTVILSALFHGDSADNMKTALRLYRGPFLLVEFIFLIAVNVYGWRSSGINHVLIFELDPRSNMSDQHLMELAAVFGIVWSLSILCFIYSSSLSIPPFLNPLVLIIIMVVFLLNPLKIFRYEARFWFLRITGRILAAPFLPVFFPQFWLADQWNSFAAAFLDFHFLICFYSTGGGWFDVKKETVAFESTRWFIISRALVNILPAWTRFWQCLRRYRDCTDNYPGHLVNAAKYSTTFLVVTFATLKTLHSDKYTDQYQNPFLYAWFACQLVSSFYASIWDVKMDWGLFNCNPHPENKFLRDEMVYSVKFYYFAIVENFVLRFIWIVSFIFTENHIASAETMISILACLEIFRRFIWNFFRLENEHLFNCGKFRAVHDITVGPLDTAEQEDIIRMIDKSDSVMSKASMQDLPETAAMKRKRKIRVQFHDIATEIADQEVPSQEDLIYMNPFNQQKDGVAINIENETSIIDKDYVVYPPGCSNVAKGTIVSVESSDMPQLKSNIADFKEQLRVWSVEHHIPQIAVKNLYDILNENYYVCVPFSLHKINNRKYRCGKT